MLYTSRIKAVFASAVLVFAVASTGYADTIVRFQTAMGDFNVQLYDSTAPGTVANFLAYVDTGRYADSFFHRLPPGFVLQGGGFTYDGLTENFWSVDTFGPIVNEFDPGRSNLRGTLAMAKQGGDPHSATSQFFINLGDNSANLDNQNGGFTVFGEVMGNGMAVVDELASVPTFPLEVLNTPLTDVPLINYTPGGTVGLDNLEMFNIVPYVDGDVDGPYLPGDVDGDGLVGGSDLVALLTNWGQAGMMLKEGDLTGDGFVGREDLEAILTNWDWGQAGMMLEDAEVTGDGFVGGSELVALLTNWGQWGMTLEDGDLTGDGFVGRDDLEAILANWDWGQAGMMPENGELSGYGSVGADDYVEVSTNWASGAAEPIPEPATLGLLLLGGLVLLRRRRVGLR